MSNQYEHVGEHLNTPMARQLVLEFFKGQDRVKKQDIIKKVDEVHENKGGLKYNSKVHPVTNVLNNLKRENLADNENYPKNSGIWDIIDNEKKPAPDPNGCVYVYYYPAYKERAELKGEDRWPCKIGYTETGDPQGRIEDQVTGMPEEPKTEVVMYTENPRNLEQIIHSILKEKDMHIQDAPGNEWFLISSDIAKKVANAFEVFQKSLDFGSSIQ